MGDSCYEDCARAPFDCTCCSRMCEPYNYDEEKQEYVYKDLFRPKTSPVVLGNGEEGICEYINNHIEDLHIGDCGAFQIRDEKIGKVVDMEWSDGVSGFVLKDVLDYIKENGTVKRSELMEFTY